MARNVLDQPLELHFTQEEEEEEDSPLVLDQDLVPDEVKTSQRLPARFSQNSYMGRSSQDSPVRFSSQNSPVEDRAKTVCGTPILACIGPTSAGRIGVPFSDACLEAGCFYCQCRVQVAFRATPFARQERFLTTLFEELYILGEQKKQLIATVAKRDVLDLDLAGHFVAELRRSNVGAAYQLVMCVWSVDLLGRRSLLAMLK